MSLRSVVWLLVAVWCCVALLSCPASASEEVDEFDGEGSLPRWARTSAPPLNIEARRWLISRMGPIGQITPGKLNLFNFTRPEGQRIFYLYAPSTYNNATSWPLAIYYHGYTGSWMQGAYTLNMTVDAEKAGYLLIFGQGTPGPAGLAWEAGLCCIFNESTIVDDIAYTRTVIKLTQAAVNVDPDRVYAMGWSNGGYMSERLACEAPELFAAVAADASAVAVRPGGRVGLASCDKTFGTHTLNYLHFHGTADTAVPWTGSLDSNGSLVVPGTLENIARWVSRLDCDAAVRQTYNDYTFSNMVWGSCRGGRQVELMTVKNGVHAWWMAQSDHFATTTYVLDFFTKTHKAQSKGKGKGEKGVLGGLLDMFN